MNNILLSTAYLGNIFYFSQIAKAESVLIEKHENFVKQTYRNRCSILGANGKLDLTIPVVKYSGKKIKISATEISYQDNWNKQHWQSITSAYNSSPFFEFYKDDFEPLFMEKPQNLLDFNNKLQSVCLDILQLSAKISYTEDFIPMNDTKGYTDMRNSISPKIQMDIPDQQEYHQVFEEKHGFTSNLSIIDLIFNEGPNAASFL